MSFDFAKFLRSFLFAGRGVKILLTSQQNARVHLLAAAAVEALGLFFDLTRTEWLWIISAIVLVFFAESINTAIEYLGDAVSPEINPRIQKAKDLAAAAVLLAAIGAALIGLLIFYPYLTE